MSSHPARSKTFDAFAATAAAAWCVGLVVHAFAGRPKAALVCGAAILWVVFARWLGRRGSELLSLHLGIGGSILAISVTAAMSGGADAPTLMALPAAALGAGVLAGASAGIAWGLVSVLSVAVLSYLDHHDAFAHVPYTTVETTAAQVAAVGVMTGAGILAHALHRSAVLAIRDRARRAEELAKQLEVARKAAEDTVRQRNEFLVTITHELRTPLGGIVGLANALDGDRLDPSQRDIVRTLRASTASLKSLVDDLLDMESMDRGRLRVERSVLTVEAVIGDVIDLFAIPAHRKGIVLVAQIDPSVPEAIEGDPQRVRQVVSNLVSNAVKYTDSGEIIVRLEVRDGRLSIHVRDTGPGMTPELVERLFRPFERSANERQRRVTGTGLGLVISKRFVEAMGGTMRVESTLGVGSSFIVELPCVRVGSAPTAGEASPCVLVVEGTEAERVACGALCARHGMEGTVVATADQAIARLASTSLDVVVLDTNVDGWIRVVAAARGRERPATVVLALAPDGSNQNVVSASLGPLAGDVSIVFKPLSWTRVMAAARGAEPRRPRSSHPRPDGRVLDVLVVDDDPTNRMVARLLVERAGHRVLQAESGWTALSVLEASDVDVALLDLHMPDMHGTELARRILARSARPPLLVALTAAAFTDNRAATEAAGMRYFLSKPIDTAALARILDEASRMERGAVSLPPVVTSEVPVPAAPVPLRPVEEAPDVVELVDAQQFDEVLSLFESPGERASYLDDLRKAIRSTIESLAEAVRTSSLEAIAALAHRLAGTSGTVGARRLRVDALALEVAVRTGADIEPKWAAVRTTAADTLAELVALEEPSS